MKKQQMSSSLEKIILIQENEKNYKRVYAINNKYSQFKFFDLLKELINNIMKTQPSEFYGVPVLDYNINSLKEIGITQGQLQKICFSNAHVYAHAYQNGYKAPSDSRIQKTILKNTKGVEPVVNRLNRQMRKYKNTAQLFGQIFRKNKVQQNKKAVPHKSSEPAYNINSPQQIVLKCARQAFSRRLIQKQSIKIVNEQKKSSNAKEKRKQHQKQRRNERVLLMKAYKNILVGIYGQIIYRSGWKIGRCELKKAIDLPEEAYNINLMINIIKHRQQIGRQRIIVFEQKRKAYLKQKFQRMKQIKKIRAFYRNKYFNTNKIAKHQKEDHHDYKIMKKNNQNQTKRYGELQKRKRKRQFIKKRIYPEKQNNNIKRQILLQIIDNQQEEFDSQNDEERFQQQPLRQIK